MKNMDVITPVFYVTDDNKNVIKEIERKLDLIIIEDNEKKMIMRIKSKVRSIYSSLAIEANSLSLESVHSIVDSKMVFGNRKEIQEVKNANELYEHINEYNWKSEFDFLKAHTLMMKYFDDDNGYYRNHGEGVKRGDEIIYSAPQSILVPSLMKSLFKYMVDNENKIHPLILSSIFHYYFVYIHPFSDGNGRMARFWVSLILSNWNSKFEYIPIEEEIYLNQQMYYDSIAQCHINGNVNVFINFMLKCINSSLEKITQKTTQKTTQKIMLNDNQLSIIELIKENSKITRNELANILNITPDGVKYNLKKLIDNGFIERVGPDNGGYWKIK
ncbi:MAG: Fic family protein [Bacilli bacterium]|nr:Fic family protein [Bacilli bacterium]